MADEGSGKVVLRTPRYLKNMTDQGSPFGGPSVVEGLQVPPVLLQRAHSRRHTLALSWSAPGRPPRLPCPTSALVGLAHGWEAACPSRSLGPRGAGGHVSRTAQDVGPAQQERRVALLSGRPLADAVDLLHRAHRLARARRPAGRRQAKHDPPEAWSRGSTIASGCLLRGAWSRSLHAGGRRGRGRPGKDAAAGGAAALGGIPTGLWRSAAAWGGRSRGPRVPMTWRSSSRSSTMAQRERSKKEAHERRQAAQAGDDT